MSVAHQMVETLNRCIQDIASTSEMYVKHPGRDFTRRRKLDLSDLIKLILSMKGGSLNVELHEYKMRSDVCLSTSAFVQQRSKVLPNLFEDLFHAYNHASHDNKTYHGYRLFAVDGSDLNTSRDPNAETFIVSSENPKGYNQYHLNALYDLCNKVYTDCVLQPRPQMDERQALITMLHRNQFTGKNLIIADRGFESYNMIAHMLRAENVDFLARVKHGKGAMTEVAKLPMQTLDRDITITITTTQTNEDKQMGRRLVQVASRNKKSTNPIKNTAIGTLSLHIPEVPCGTIPVGYRRV